MSALSWGLLSFFGFVISFSVLIWPVGQLQQAGVDHAATLGAWAFLWVPTSSAGALIAARLTFGAWPAVRPSAWLIVLIGMLVSAAHFWITADWAIARYGYSDPEFVGPVFGVFALVAAAAVAGFGIQFSPRWAVWSPFLALATAVFIAGSVLLESLPGLADGLAPDSWPLAIATVAAAVYIAAVALASVARLRSSSVAPRHSDDQSHGDSTR
jgi:hypothetical protein